MTAPKHLPLAALLASLCLGACLVSGSKAPVGPVYDTMDKCVLLLSSCMSDVETPVEVWNFMKTVESTLPGINFEEYSSVSDERSQLLRMGHPAQACTEFLEAVEAGEEQFRVDGPRCGQMIEADQDAFSQAIKGDETLANLLPKREACWAFEPEDD